MPCRTHRAEVASRTAKIVHLQTVAQKREAACLACHRAGQRAANLSKLSNSSPRLTVEALEAEIDALAAQADDVSHNEYAFVAVLDQMARLTEVRDALAVTREITAASLAEQDRLAHLEGVRGYLDSEDRLLPYLFLVSRKGKEAGRVPETLTIAQCRRVLQHAPAQPVSKSHRYVKAHPFGRVATEGITDALADALGFDSTDAFHAELERYAAAQLEVGVGRRMGYREPKAPKSWHTPAARRVLKEVA